VSIWQLQRSIARLRLLGAHENSSLVTWVSVGESVRDADAIVSVRNKGFSFCLVDK
jgi:hypothetical protein